MRGTRPTRTGPPGRRAPPRSPSRLTCPPNQERPALERDEVSDEEWEQAMGRRVEDVFGPDDDGHERRAS
ncbi:hypothetical protein GCM10010495_49030 [Kitasatospora herbaricolor]|nr:hypothetical protein GCM10010495_49030 [Kitasatospora herbaricolor]